MCAAVPRLISPVPSELAPIVNRRHDGSEQCQPARFAIWSLVFSVNSSRFVFAIERGYVDLVHTNQSEGNYRIVRTGSNSTRGFNVEAYHFNKPSIRFGSQPANTVRNQMPQNNALEGTRRTAASWFAGLVSASTCTRMLSLRFASVSINLSKLANLLSNNARCC